MVPTRSDNLTANMCINYTETRPEDRKPLKPHPTSQPKPLNPKPPNPKTLNYKQPESHRDQILRLSFWQLEKLTQLSQPAKGLG